MQFVYVAKPFFKSNVYICHTSCDIFFIMYQIDKKLFNICNIAVIFNKLNIFF